MVEEKQFVALKYNNPLKSSSDYHRKAKIFGSSAVVQVHMKRKMTLENISKILTSFLSKISLGNVIVSSSLSWNFVSEAHSPISRGNSIPL